MDKFLKLENEFLKIKIDIQFGGKIVQILDKKIILIGFGLMRRNILILNRINFLTMTHNGLAVMKSYFQTIKLKL